MAKISDCDSEDRGFKSLLSPHLLRKIKMTLEELCENYIVELYTVISKNNKYIKIIAVKDNQSYNDICFVGKGKTIQEAVYNTYIEILSRT